MFGNCIDINRAADYEAGSFDIVSTDIIDLDGIQYFTNLSTFHIYNNDSLTSLPDLSGLTNLTDFGIYKNEGLECVGGYPEQFTIDESWPPVCPSACPYEAFLEYSPDASSYDYAACITPVVMGCMDSIAENYNIEANDEDGSCEYILGCMDNDADNFNQEATQEDNSCIYYGCIDSLANNYDLIANQDDGSCIYFGCIDESADNFDANANTDSGECIYLGCIDESADNYNTEANSNDGSCIFIGCTNEIAENYNSQANQDDGSCIILGCTNFTAENYFTQANQDDESCLILGCTFDIFPNYNSEANEEDGSCDMNSEDVFGCTDSLSIHHNDLANIDNGSCNNIVRVGDENFGGIVFFVDSTGRRGLLAAKDDLPGTYEWGCYQQEVNGADGIAIGTGYQNTMDIVNQGCSTQNGGITAAQAALNAEINGFSDWYLPSKEENVELFYSIGNITSLLNSAGLENDFWYWSSSAVNSESVWNLSDSFYLLYTQSPKNGNVICKVRPIRAFGNWTMGCMDETACNFNPEANMADGSCEYAEQGYDCEGNITAEIGDIIEGGYLFYLDETGTRGLVAAMEDVSEEALWWFYAMDSLDNFISNSQYNDWYVPRKNELELMYSSFGDESTYVDFNFSSWYSYWSATQNENLDHWVLGFNNGSSGWINSGNTCLVRPIRAFGNWAEGCMDSLACNFNSEANMADGSCEYANEGYDCEGNINEYLVGMEAEGGIIFYVDETGQHGLVAAVEDLTEGATDTNGFGFNGYEWGCFFENVSGADGQAIGTGYQNTMDIVSQGCVTENGGITAAQAALDAEVNGYIDWYLPSIDELNDMYNTIGPGGLESNTGGFDISVNSYYWSSSEINNMTAWGVYFDNGVAELSSKNNARRVRVIRAF